LGGGVTNPSYWNKLLFELLQNIDPRRFGVTPSLFQRIVTAEMVKLQGSTSGSRQYLVVNAERWVRDGLEAYIGLKLDKGISPQDASFHRRNLAVMMRRLEKVAAAYVDSRLPRIESGERWSAAAGIAQVLVVRAWLRGTIAPEASVPEHMRATLSDEPEAMSDPKARSSPWQEWLTATDKWHDRLRSELRNMISLSIGEGSGGAGLTDSSEIAGAIERIKNTGRADEVPAEEGSLPDVLSRGRELAALWRDKRYMIDRTEAGQLKGRIESLFTLLRGRGIADHLARVDDAISKVSDLMPKAAPEMVGNWKQAYSRLTAKLQEGAGRRLEEFMANFEDPEEWSAQQTAPRLGWMARAPAKDLADFLELANLGERLVGELYQHVDDCVREAAGIGSLAEIRRIGSALKAASRREGCGGAHGR